MKQKKADCKEWSKTKKLKKNETQSTNQATKLYA